MFNKSPHTSWKSKSAEWHIDRFWKIGSQYNRSKALLGSGYIEDHYCALGPAYAYLAVLREGNMIVKKLQ